MRMQPTFRVRVPGSISEATARLQSAAASDAHGPHADAGGSCLDFRVAPEERRLWSPHLSVQLTPTDDGVVLFGRFAPRPEVWTFVMMLYFAAAFVAICGLVYGLVQVLLGATPWALAAIPAGLVVVLSLHVISLTGQRLSADQMEALRGRLDHVVREAFGSQEIG